MAGRRRKRNVMRDCSGKSRGERPDAIMAVALAYRARDVGERDAGDPLAGFTLGRLLLRRRACPTDPSGITQEQYLAGEEWGRLVLRHAAIMGYALGSPQSPSLTRVGSGVLCLSEPSEQEIAAVRRKWSACYNALMEVCRVHGLGVRDVTYAVCVENRALETLRDRDFGTLRLGLNALAKALR